jgi:hypothetical protein
MALARWLGVDANWNNTSNWSTGAAPTSSDSVYFPAGSQSVTTNMDQTLVNLLGLETAPDYTGDIGASGAPLRVTCDKVVHRGTGTIYYTDENSGGNTENTDVIIVNTPGNLTNSFVLTANGAADDAIDVLIVHAGKVTTSATAVTDIFVTIDPTGPLSTASVSSSTDSSIWHINHGNITFTASVGALGKLHIKGGNVSGVITSVLDVTMTGGRLTFDNTAAVVGDQVNGRIELSGGVLDIRNSPVTGFGNTTGNGSRNDFYALPGTKILRRSDQSLSAGDNLYIAPGVEATSE